MTPNDPAKTPADDLTREFALPIFDTPDERLIDSPTPEGALLPPQDR